jgi:hypothetical protein
VIRAVPPSGPLPTRQVRRVEQLQPHGGRGNGSNPLFYISGAILNLVGHRRLGSNVIRIASVRNIEIQPAITVVDSTVVEHAARTGEPRLIASQFMKPSQCAVANRRFAPRCRPDPE